MDERKWSKEDFILVRDIISKTYEASIKVLSDSNKKDSDKWTFFLDELRYATQGWIDRIDLINIPAKILDSEENLRRLNSATYHFYYDVVKELSNMLYKVIEEGYLKESRFDSWKSKNSDAINILRMVFSHRELTKSSESKIKKLESFLKQIKNEIPGNFAPLRSFNNQMTKEEINAVLAKDGIKKQFIYENYLVTNVIDTHYIFWICINFEERIFLRINFGNLAIFFFMQIMQLLYLIAQDLNIDNE